MHFLYPERKSYFCQRRRQNREKRPSSLPGRDRQERRRPRATNWPNIYDEGWRRWRRRLDPTLPPSIRVTVEVVIPENNRTGKAKFFLPLLPSHRQNATNRGGGGGSGGGGGGTVAAIAKYGGRAREGESGRRRAQHSTPLLQAKPLPPLYPRRPCNFGLATSKGGRVHRQKLSRSARNIKKPFPPKKKTEK